MTNFAPWLHDINDEKDAALVELNAFADSNSAKWPYWSDTPDAYLAMIATTAADADKLRLTAALANAYARWKAEQKLSFGQALLTALVAHFGQLALAAFGIIFALLLYNGLSPTFLQTLANTEQVRGIITFFFVLSTTSIIVLFALSIFWMKNNADVTERFKSAKDLLTIVIGVLGTIMGFYFGTATGESGAPKFAASALTPTIVRLGEAATLAATISGGTKPYKFSLQFTASPENVTPAELNVFNAEGTGDSPDGSVLKKITIPATIKAPAIASYILTATDAKNAKITSSGTLNIEKAPDLPVSGR